MADVVISIVAKVAEYLVTPVIREGRYFLCFNKIKKDLENEKEQLTFESDSLQDRVQKANERTEVIEKPVEKWLNDVKKQLEEVAGLEQRMGENNNCSQGWCPTWRRYRLCKQVVKKIEAMGKFKGKSNIQPFSYCVQLPGIQYKSSKNFTFFESTKVVYDQLLESLQDDCIYMIGVYGMGGSGKTTLVTEVGKNAEELNLFDMVISITISQTPNIRNIQGKIADMLGLKLKEESEEGRAQRLWLSLKDKKHILIIVDDLWGEFNLENTGICLDNDCKGRWKVIVTTRRQEICNLMDCQKKIHPGLLSTYESWTLFEKHANIDHAFSKSLNDVPWELCKECNCLPIAIVAIASSLRGKSKVEWEVALHNLRHSGTTDDHVEEGVGAAMSCLKLSYDYLKNKDAKLLFLMCSMFPEDHLISTEVLIRCAVGLGLGGRFSLESARSRMVAGINKLLDSCLLMHRKKRRENYVKMHDIVRDVALWIAKRSEDHKILVNLDKPLITLEEDDDMRDYFAVSSWYVENQISIQLDAPNLEILLLNTGSQDLLDSSHANFEGIEGLKVFYLANNYFPLSTLSLPLSFLSLTNLKTLRLTKWHLGDISFIASLTRLEVLDLEGCYFNELPSEMGKLKRLKLLDLSNCCIHQNYNGAIGKFLQLEEFYASELQTFRHIPQILVDIGTLPKLQRFVIYGTSSMFLYYATLRYRTAEGRRVFELYDINISDLNAAEKNLLQKADVTRLTRIHGGCKNFIPDLIGAVGGMNYLTDLRLVECAEIECFFHDTSHTEVDALIPRLVELWLSNLENLKELCQGPPLRAPRFFETLEKLFIFDCYQLHNIFPRECRLLNLKILTIENQYPKDCKLEVLFSMSVARSLQQLEKLILRCCTELKQIIASEREHGSNASQEIVTSPRNSHFVMPNLKEVDIHDCWKLECIFPICCLEGFAQLQSIKISMAPDLKYVFGECDHEDNSSLQYENQNVFPDLEVLLHGNLDNLVGICPENYHAKWPSLGKLTVKDYPEYTRSWNYGGWF